MKNRFYANAEANLFFPYVEYRQDNILPFHQSLLLIALENFSAICVPPGICSLQKQTSLQPGIKVL